METRPEPVGSSSADLLVNISDDSSRPRVHETPVPQMKSTVISMVGESQSAFSRPESSGEFIYILLTHGIIKNLVRKHFNYF